MMKPIYQFFIFFFLPFSVISANDKDLIFKGCANQRSSDTTGVFSQNLKTLLTSLVSQSSQTSYAGTTSGTDNATAVSGVFQCRGDLHADQCFDCVSKIPKLVYKLCGGDDNGNVVVAARVQLAGCYIRYEVSGFQQTSGTEMLFRVCGKKHSGDTGFSGKRDTAFGMAVTGVKTGGNNGGGFYTGQYESVYVLGQCEGSLGNSDCGECVKQGFDKAKSECGDSISGQVYLHKCFVSYSYYARGVPNISSLSDGEKRQHTQRTIALVVGGVAVLGFVVVCLLVLRSAMKKKKSKYDAY